LVDSLVIHGNTANLLAVIPAEAERLATQRAAIEGRGMPKKK
jgi:hypothetical protein